MAQLKIHWLQHVRFEGLGDIAPGARRHDHALSCTRLYADGTLLAVDAFDWLVVMGGQMGVYEADQHPHITAEIALIEASIAAARRLLDAWLDRLAAA